MKGNIILLRDCPQTMSSRNKAIQNPALFVSLCILMSTLPPSPTPFQCIIEIKLKKCTFSLAHSIISGTLQNIAIELSRNTKKQPFERKTINKGPELSQTINLLALM